MIEKKIASFLKKYHNIASFLTRVTSDNNINLRIIEYIFTHFNFYKNNIPATMIEKRIFDAIVTTRYYNIKNDNLTRILFYFTFYSMRIM